MLDLVESSRPLALDGLAQRVRGVALASADAEQTTDFSVLVSALYLEHLSPQDRVLISPQLLPYVAGVRQLFQLPADPLAPPHEPLTNTWSGDFLTSVSVTDSLRLGGAPEAQVVAVGDLDSLGASGTIDVVEGMSPSSYSNLIWIVTYSIGQFRKASSWRDGLAQLGWHTVNLGHGPKLTQAAKQYPQLRASLERAAGSGLRGSALRELLLDGAPPEVWRLTGSLEDHDLEALLLDSGGNDPNMVRTGLSQVRQSAGRAAALFVEVGASTQPSGVLPATHPADLSLVSLRARDFAPEPQLTVSRVSVPSVQLAKQSRVSTAEAVNRAITRLRADDALGGRLIEIDNLNGANAALAKAAGLGRSWRVTGRALMPVLRLREADLDGLVGQVDRQLLAGARFIIVGGDRPVRWKRRGADQLGAIRPHMTVFEPAYAQAASWLVRGALERLGDRLLVDRVGNADQGGYYFQVSDEAVDQLPFEEAMERIGAAVLRRQVLGGAYRLREAEVRPGTHQVQLVASGADIPLALGVAEHLELDDMSVHVVDVTSLDRLHGGWLRTGNFTPTMLRAFLPRKPMVTLDTSGRFAWLAQAMGSKLVELSELDPGLASEVEWSRKRGRH